VPHGPFWLANSLEPTAPNHEVAPRLSPQRYAACYDATAENDTLAFSKEKGWMVDLVRAKREQDDRNDLGTIKERLTEFSRAWLTEDRVM